MKKIILGLLLISTPAFAAEEFICKVEKKVVTQSTCHVCVERRRDTCIRYAEEPCLSHRTESAGLKDSTVINRDNIFLTAKNNEFGFVFAHGSTGFTANVSSYKDGALARTSSSRPIDLEHDSFSLEAETNLSRDIVGNLISVQLDCRSNW